MKIAVPKETATGETRVALVPDTVKALAGQGHQVTVEAGAGAAAYFSDDAYREAGAAIEAERQALYRDADVVVKVQRPSNEGEPGGDEVALLREGSALVTFLQPLNNREQIGRLASRKVDAFAMELIPRISRAQNMDALSSMATVAGYKAVLLAADAFPRFFPMFMTAAGTIKPARAMVLGAGVAGLQAIATAKRLGAVVEALDTRAVAKEQVESLGARFVSLDFSEEMETAGGYAKELSEEQHRREVEVIAQHIRRSDIVITTAQVPGRAAPVLIARDMVEAMAPASVIVDLAVETGGNCELSRLDEVVEHQGVRIIGRGNLPALMPLHASQMYSRNVSNLLQHLSGEEGRLHIEREDPVTSGTLVTHQGEVVHPALQD